MPMTPDQERWAEALQVEKMFGLGAAAFVAERIATLGMMSDAVGVQRWTEIADRLVALRRAGRAS